MFDVDRLNVWAWIGVGVLLVIAGNLYFDGKADQDIASRERVPAGTVQSISTATSFWGDTSTLQLNGGKVVILDGTINPWQPGEAVGQPVVQKDDSDKTTARLKKTWCVGDKCLSQH